MPHACVTCDADYGDNPHFLNGLEQRGERHVVAVRASFSVTLGRGPASLVQRADAVLAARPRQDWQTMAWSVGAGYARMRDASDEKPAAPEYKSAWRRLALTETGCPLVR